MPVKVLTTRSIEALRPQAKRMEYADASCPGLYHVVQPSGGRSWALRYRRLDGRSAKLTLGNGSLSLAAARHAAAAARLRLDQGTDPAPKLLPRTAEHYDPTNGDAIEAAVAAFLEKHARVKNRASTAWAAERIFVRLVLPAWKGRSVRDIRRRDIIALVEHVATDRPYLANRTLAVLSKFFSWLVARDEITSNPATGVERPHVEEARDRVLTDPELKALWMAGADDTFGQALRLLILTGARRNEVSRMTWSEIDPATRQWTIPRERSKNKQAHSVPLGEQAWRIIEAMPRIAGCPYVFTADGKSPVIGWAKAKTRLSAKAGLDEASWRLHDLRRTAASGLQKLGVQVPVIEKALNHSSGVFRGITGVYQRHDYASEIAIALRKWGDHVEQLAGGEPAKVIPLRGRQ